MDVDQNNEWYKLKLKVTTSVYLTKHEEVLGKETQLRVFFTSAAHEQKRSDSS
jgi:hypothetical protein